MEDSMRVAPDSSAHRQQQALVAPDTDVMASPSPPQPARPPVHALEIDEGNVKSHRLRNSSIMSINQPLLGSARPSFAETTPAALFAATVEPATTSAPNPSRPTRDTHAAAASQRAYMHAIRRLHAIKDLEKKSLAHVPTWRTDLIRTIGQLVDDTVHAITIWRNAIHSIEGKQGSHVAQCFYVIRSCWCLNLLLVLLWACLVVLPCVISPPAFFSWRLFLSRHAWARIWQGDSLDTTPLLFGGYAMEPMASTPLRFTLALLGMYAISLATLLIIVYRRTVGHGDAMLMGGSPHGEGLFPFAALTLGSWDYGLTSPQASQRLRAVIAARLTELLHDAELEQLPPPPKAVRWGNIAIKVLGMCIIWPIMVLVTAWLVYLVVNTALLINNTLGFPLAHVGALSLISFLSQHLAVLSTMLEGWKGRRYHTVLMLKYFSIKMVNLASLAYQLYRIQRGDATRQFLTAALDTSQDPPLIDTQGCSLDLPSWQASLRCPRGQVCCDSTCPVGLDQLLNLSTPSSTLGAVARCVPACEDNTMGLLLYRLLLVNAVVINALDMLTAVFRRMVGWPGQYDAAMVIVWLGSLSAPLLPLVGLINNTVTFEVKWLLAWSLYAPPTTLYSANRTSNTGYLLMLGALLLCSGMAVFQLQWGARRCGPVAPGANLLGTLSDAIARGPGILQTIVEWLLSPVVLVGAVAVLGAVALLANARAVRHGRAHRWLALQFERYRAEMHAKVVVTRHEGSAAMEKPRAGSVSAAATPHN